MTADYLVSIQEVRKRLEKWLPKPTNYEEAVRYNNIMYSIDTIPEAEPTVVLDKRGE